MPLFPEDYLLPFRTSSGNSTPTVLASLIVSETDICVARSEFWHTFIGGGNKDSDIYVASFYTMYTFSLS